MKLARVEINFPFTVDVPDKWQQRLCDLVSEICGAYEAAHPDRVMWVFGVGSKITYMPMTQEEERERGLEFDDDTLELQISERERYDTERSRRMFPPVAVKDEALMTPSEKIEMERARRNFGKPPR